ncbi:hypothetical protein LA76x_0948 [Lysobacter antibioticus]|uniref:Uncharacterized protein n=1 Tax=Lysobacter antibioticus TaxID=84531 RepID=A0A0S2F6C0_LYSAN|nr:hypothetical protein LA76x_0948 [Lysobacter antibioticus]
MHRIRGQQEGGRECDRHDHATAEGCREGLEFGDHAVCSPIAVVPSSLARDVLLAKCSKCFPDPDCPRRPLWRDCRLHRRRPLDSPFT